MDESPMQIETPRLCPRPSYKGKYLVWRTAALVLFTAWMFTLGAMFYYRSRPCGAMTVIYPSLESQKR